MVKKDMIAQRVSMLLSQRQDSQLLALDQWFYTPQGTWVGHAWAAELDAFKSYLSGEQLLQIGSCGRNLWLPSLSYQNIRILGARQDSSASFNGLVNALPIDRDTMDCIVAPFSMELFFKNKNVLDEFDRVLKPNGYLIVFGVNPWSLWGGALKFKSIPEFSKVSISLTSSFIVRRAFQNRHYMICNHRSFYYIPPVRESNLIARLEFFNEVGKMAWPCPPGFYCMIMQKRQWHEPNRIVRAVRSTVRVSLDNPFPV